MDSFLWGKTRTATWEVAGLYIASVHLDLKNITGLDLFFLGEEVVITRQDGGQALTTQVGNSLQP